MATQDTPRPRAPTLRLVTDSLWEGFALAAALLFISAVACMTILPHMDAWIAGVMHCEEALIVSISVVFTAALKGLLFLLLIACVVMERITRRLSAAEAPVAGADAGP